ncbi:MAG TPA: carboxypeptidase-like regulatory domain-containing protein [Thermoanaerobaculia bacterium]|nr:carboxypeptidase-like regulatory domain-containing protein [Thermoanaerobaculia bacterium]
MPALYLGITALLALVDAAASWRAWSSGAPGAEGLALLQLFWAFVSGLFIWAFRSRGIWAGAPIAHAAGVLLGILLVANGSDASPFWWPIRILMATAVLVLSATTLRTVLTTPAEDLEGEPPPHLGAITSAALVLVGLACGATYAALQRASPVTATAAPEQRASTMAYELSVQGRVLRPDGFPLLAVAVKLTPQPGPGRVGAFAGETEVRTERDGRFAFAGTSTEERVPYRLTFEVMGYKRKVVEGTTDRAAGDLEIVLSPDV